MCVGAQPDGHPQPGGAAAGEGGRRLQLADGAGGSLSAAQHSRRGAGGAHSQQNRSNFDIMPLEIIKLRCVLLLNLKSMKIWVATIKLTSKCESQ